MLASALSLLLSLSCCFGTSFRFLFLLGFSDDFFPDLGSLHCETFVVSWHFDFGCSRVSVFTCGATFVARRVNLALLLKWSSLTSNSAVGAAPDHCSNVRFL